VDGGAALLAQMTAAAASDDVLTFQAIVDTARPVAKKSAKLPRRFRVKLVYCKKCLAGHLAPALVTGQGKGIKTTPMGDVPVPVAFVQRVTGATARP
jgi:hypothetical protein